MDNQFNLEFDSYINEWQLIIEAELCKRNLKFKEYVPKYITISLEKQLKKFLTENKFKNDISYLYRFNLHKYMIKKGVKIEIISNNLLWMYLHNFIDLKEYDNCFNINLVVYNLDMAVNSNIIEKKSDILELPFKNVPEYILKNEYLLEMHNIIEELKQLNDNTIINKIIKLSEAQLKFFEKGK